MNSRMTSRWWAMRWWSWASCCRSDWWPTSRSGSAPVCGTWSSPPSSSSLWTCPVTHYDCLYRAVRHRGACTDTRTHVLVPESTARQPNFFCLKSKMRHNDSPAYRASPSALRSLCRWVGSSHWLCLAALCLSRRTAGTCRVFLCASGTSGTQPVVDKNWCLRVGLFLTTFLYVNRQFMEP